MSTQESEGLMKNVAIVGILAVSSLFAVGQATHHAPKSAAAKSATPDSDTTQIINIVRNGYLEYNKTITIGQALAGTFHGGEWKVFKTEKGAVIVEFDAAEPLSKFQGESGLLDSGCADNPSCAALNTKVNDYCQSTAVQTQYAKNYEHAQEALKAQIEASESSYKGSVSGFDQASYDLKEKLWNMARPEYSCLSDIIKQHAGDPVPVAVQFSINHDGTFQYEANDMGLSGDALVVKIYE
jgi:hypothetical protein